MQEAKTQQLAADTKSKPSSAGSSSGGSSINKPPKPARSVTDETSAMADKEFKTVQSFPSEVKKTEVKSSTVLLVALGAAIKTGNVAVVKQLFDWFFARLHDS